MTARARRPRTVGASESPVSFAPLQAGEGRLVAAWASRSRRRRPVVLLLPGLYQVPGALFHWMFRLAQGGALAATFEDTLSLRADGLSDLAGGLERLLEALIGRARSTLEALAALPAADPDRMALIGVSAGGWAALRLAEERCQGTAPAGRVAAVAAVLSGAGWRRIPEGVSGFFEEVGVRCHPDMAGVPVDPGRFPLLHPGDPAERAERLRGCALLLVAGAKDPLVDAAEVRAFYQELAARLPEAGERLQFVVYSRVGHRLTPPMEDRVASWVLWMLGAGGLRG